MPYDGSARERKKYASITLRRENIHHGIGERASNSAETHLECELQILENDTKRKSYLNT